MMWYRVVIGIVSVVSCIWSFVDCVGDVVYTVQSKLGEGAFAKIYRIVAKDGESQSHTGVIKVCIYTLYHFFASIQYEGDSVKVTQYSEFKGRLYRAILAMNIYKLVVWVNTAMAPTALPDWL